MSSKPISLRASATGISPVRAYIAPFLVFIALRWLPIRPEWLAPARFVLVAASIAVFSRRLLRWRLAFPWTSILLGVGVLLVWIGPDALWPGYRDFWLFHNGITGVAVSTLPARLKSDAFFIAIRVGESVVLVPILEELFWRGWLMRWLIRPAFEEVPFGQYTPVSFWVTALLFAAEHGPYWEVGLIAGVAYNWWIVRTRNLADCMLAHGVTNGVLAAYVLLHSQWQYWL